MKKSLGIFIVNYNSISTMSEKIYRYIDTFTYIVSEEIDVWLIDNGSTDESYTKLSQRYGNKLKFLRFSKNLGYGAACSLAYKYTKLQGLEYDYYVCSNNDIELFPDKFGELLLYLRKLEKVFPQGYVATPLLINGNDGLIDHGGYFIDDTGGTWNLRLITQTPTKIRQPILVSYADGAFQIVHKRVIETIGWFDPRFFLLYEDTEFSLRAWEVGYPSLLVPIVIGKHYRSTSLKSFRYTNLYYSYRNRVLVIRRYLGHMSLLKLFCRIISYPLILVEQELTDQNKYIEKAIMPSMPISKLKLKEYFAIGKYILRGLYDGLTTKNIWEKKEEKRNVTKTIIEIPWPLCLSMRKTLIKIKTTLKKVVS